MKSPSAVFAGKWTALFILIMAGAGFTSFSAVKVAPPEDADSNSDIKEDMRLATNDFHLGLGAYVDSNVTTIRYRNLQVRRISKSGSPTK